MARRHLAFHIKAVDEASTTMALQILVEKCKAKALQCLGSSQECELRQYLHLARPEARIDIVRTPGVDTSKSQ